MNTDDWSPIIYFQVFKILTCIDKIFEGNNLLRVNFENK